MNKIRDKKSYFPLCRIKRICKRYRNNRRQRKLGKFNYDMQSSRRRIKRIENNSGTFQYSSQHYHQRGNGYSGFLGFFQSSVFIYQQKQYEH